MPTKGLRPICIVGSSLILLGLSLTWCLWCGSSFNKEERAQWLSCSAVCCSTELAFEPQISTSVVWLVENTGLIVEWLREYLGKQTPCYLSRGWGAGLASWARELSSCTWPLLSSPQKDFTPDFMFCCCPFEILNNSWTRDLSFPFSLNPTNYVPCSGEERAYCGVAGNHCSTSLVVVYCCQAGIDGRAGFVLSHHSIFPREFGYLDFYVEFPILKYWLKFLQMLVENICKS